MKQECLVIGGSGFIGWRLSKQLARKGEKVVVFSRNGIPEKKDGIRYQKGNVQSISDLKAAVLEKSRVFHLAATRDFGAKRKLSTGASDIAGTFDLLETMRQYNDDAPILFASSSAVYGEQSIQPVNERAEPRPINAYGASKLASELYCEMFHRVYGSKVVRARLFNTYGSLQSRDLVSLTVERLLNGQTPQVAGDGLQVRDFTYVDDVVETIDRMLSESATYGKAINVGHGKGTTVLDAVKEVISVFGDGKRVTPEFTKSSAGGRGNIADISLLKELLGWHPSTDLGQGLIRMRDELRSNAHRGT
jgi:UDP-glucose 4-epimerase